MKPTKVIIHQTKPENLWMAARIAEKLLMTPEFKNLGLEGQDAGYTAKAVRNTKSISVWGSDRVDES